TYTQRITAILGADAANFVLAPDGHRPGTVTRRPAPLHVFMPDVVTTYGDRAWVPDTATLSGVLPGDDVRVRGAALRDGMSLSDRLPAGSHALVPEWLGGRDIGNYELVSTSGYLTVEPRTLELDLAVTW